VARFLTGCGATPDVISIFGLLASAGAGAAFYLTRFDLAYDWGLWIAGCLLIYLRLLANMFDGMVAIEGGKGSSVGPLYNEIPDRISDVVTLVGAGYATGGSVELGFLAACVALFVAYVRSMAASVGAPSDFGGPMAKQQRMHVVVVAAVFSVLAPAGWHLVWGPDQRWGIMAAALLFISAGGLLTAALRIRRAAQWLRNSSTTLDRGQIGESGNR
jgi:phosphatidylglycerophosphate synthase